MKKFRVTLTVDETYQVEANNEDEALAKTNGARPYDIDILDTEVEELDESEN